MSSMKLTSMKRTPAEAKAASEPSEAKAADSYPYGLEVRLDNDSLENLGITKLPEVDGVHLLVAKVKVTGVSSNQYGSSQKHQTVTLQITDMALGEAPAEKSDIDTLYGASK